MKKAIKFHIIVVVAFETNKQTNKPFVNMDRVSIREQVQLLCVWVAGCVRDRCQ